VPPGWPQKFTIPRFGVTAPFENLDLTKPQSVHAPYKWDDVAWFDLGPRPGEQGRALIFGHVDSTCCPAVFYHLRDMKAGDIVQVAYKSKSPLTFRVMWLNTYTNGGLPVSWMYARTKQRSILLITCTGIFHRDGTGYDHKFVAFARLVLPNGKLG
jgi:hypothetical protein